MKSTLQGQGKHARAAGAGPRNRFDIHPVAWGVALALASAGAWADSAVGQNTTLGSADIPAPINPAARAAGGALDPDGMGTRDPVAHSPSGIPYNLPYFDEEAPAKQTPHWTGSIDAGAQGVEGDRNAALQKMYKDDRQGGLLNFNAQKEGTGDGSYFEVNGGNIGRKDQFIGATIGRYNDYKSTFFYNETVHVFTTTAYQLQAGGGTGNLTLPSNVLPVGGAVFAGYFPTVTAASGKCSGTAVQSPNSERAGTTYTACFTSPMIGGAATPYNQAAINQAVGLQVAADLANTQASTLELTRKNAGMTYEKKVDLKWKVFGSITAEHRVGERPFGSIEGGGGGTAPEEIVEPIDYDTYDAKVGTRYVDKLTNFNLMANLDVFNNHITSLSFQNAFLPAATPTGALVQNGQFALYPDNQYYNLKADYARNLPNFWKGRFTATLSTSSERQNAHLLPPSDNGGTAGTAGQSDYDNLNLWDTPAALSQQTSNARIDIHMLDLGLGIHPTSNLDLRAKYRYYETVNKTNYFACNPSVTNPNQIAGLQANAYVNPASGCPGVWGRLLNDGGGAALVGNVSATVDTPNSNNPIRDIPYQGSQANAGLTADYRLGVLTSINASYERETWHRSYRERAETWEDKFKVTFVNRGFGDGTLRLSAEADSRRGSQYNTASPYYPFLGVSLPLYGGSTTPVPASNFVTKLADLRKFDLSDRDTGILNARLNYPLTGNLDLGASAQIKGSSYPGAADGRADQRQNSLNFDLTYNQSSSRVITGYLSFQNAFMSQHDVYPGAGTGVACVLGNVVNGVTITQANAEVVCGSVANNTSGTGYNPVNSWGENTQDLNTTLGLRWEETIGKYHLSMAYQQTNGRTELNYQYTPGVGVMPSVAAAALVGNSTDMWLDTKSLEFNMVVPVQKALTVRAMYRYEYGNIYDYHYAGLSNTNLVMWGAIATTGAPLTPVGTVMDAGPQSYHTSTVALVMNYKF